MLAKFFIFLIKIYKIIFSYRKPCCRFIPSCSSYAIDAIKEYGALRGSFLASKRILRCRPGKNFGYDPVPSRTIKKEICLNDKACYDASIEVSANKNEKFKNNQSTDEIQ